MMFLQRPLLVTLFFVSLATVSFGQNVGVNNPNPQYTLDVNGAIRTGGDHADGQLRIHSDQGATDYEYVIDPNAAATQNVQLVLPPDDGEAGQVLTSDGAGNLSWSTPAAGGGGATYCPQVYDLSFPDGLSGIQGLTLNNLFSTPYAVPVGKNFYVTSFYNLAQEELQVGGIRVARNLFNLMSGGNGLTLNQPILVGSGQVLGVTNTGGQGNTNSVVNGFLVDATVTVVTQNNLLNTGYTVPAGKILVITNVYSSGGTPYFRIDGKRIASNLINTMSGGNGLSLGQPMVVNAGQEVSAEDNGLAFNGYLRDVTPACANGGGGGGNAAWELNANGQYSQLLCQGNQTVVVGTQTGSTNGAIVTPFSSQFHDGRHQYLIAAAELQALGVCAGNISSLGFIVTSMQNVNVNTFVSASVGMKNTLTTTLSSNFEGGTTDVFTGAFTFQQGNNDITFQTPFAWDGTSNLLIQFCHDNSSTSGLSPMMATTMTNVPAYSSSLGNVGDYQQGLCFPYANGSAGQERPIIRLGATALTNNAGTADWLSVSNKGVVIGSPNLPQGVDHKGPGTLAAEAIYDDNTLLSDYVFDYYFDGKVSEKDQLLRANYRMLSIEEMVEFMRAHRHLPTIKGRAEWESKGPFSLGELSTQLWSTVETQALYIKELKDVNDRQQSEIEALNARLEKLEALLLKIADTKTSDVSKD